MAAPALHTAVGGRQLIERFSRVRALTEALASPLSPEDQTVQSMPDVSPTKWHRAHTTWFFETFVLESADPSYRLFDPSFGYLFNSYYDGVGPRHPRAERGLVSRPGASEVGRYREAVDAALTDALERGRLDEVAGFVDLGVHHEQQHQELLLMDIKHVLSCNPTAPVYVESTSPGPARDITRPTDVWLSSPSRLVEIGYRGDGFCFDNECPRHRTLLPPYRLRRNLVTCGEWIQFIEDGGYRTPELWLSDGWATVNARGWQAPEYWTHGDNGWEIFTLHGTRPVDSLEPVAHVSYFEADAFAHWAGARLPTEFEWEAFAVPDTRVAAPDSVASLHPAPPVGGDSDFFGQVWQWTRSAYAPYPGFRPLAGAVGEYNGKFMVNQQVLRGSCCVTPVGHSRPTYRNFFPAAARWAFAGVRLATDGDPV